MLYDTEFVPAYAAVVSAFARKIDNHVTNRSRRERFAGMPNVCLRAHPRVYSVRLARIRSARSASSSSAG